MWSHLKEWLGMMWKEVAMTYFKIPTSEIPILDVFPLKIFKLFHPKTFPEN